MKYLLAIVLLSFSIGSYAECVILLHGLARSSSSMATLEKSLKDEGYTVVNQDYPSRQHNIEKLAKLAITSALDSCPINTKINFVTHSLGGILVRQYLSNQDIKSLHRVVMLGPPNKGSEVVDTFQQVPGFHFINGDAGLQLGTGNMSIPKTLGKANFDVGIIAGTRSINLILSSIIPDTDDGKVSISSTKLDSMNDHIEMAVSHPFMMKNNSVISQVIHFLKTGKFIRHKE